MSSPKRWLDAGDDLTPDERRALRADLDDQPPLHAKRAVRAALSLKLAAASAAAAAPGAVRGSVQKGAAAKLVGLSMLKSAGLAFAVSAAISAGFSLRERHHAAHESSGGSVQQVSPLPSASAHELHVPAQSHAAVQAEPSSSPTNAAQGPSLRRSAPRNAVGEPPSLPPVTALSESQRVAEARALLRSGRASDALAALQALERDEPNGLLAQEREALAIQALSALGQREAASRRAAVFAARYPASPHLSAVRRAAE